MQKNYRIHLFLGCLKNSELLMHLRQSKQWREAGMLGAKELSEAHFQELEYIGKWHLSSTISSINLMSLKQQTMNQLRIYCPDLNIEKIDFTLFPQVFVG
jgi:hypothetical protein